MGRNGPITRIVGNISLRVRWPRDLHSASYRNYVSTQALGLSAVIERIFEPSECT